MNNKSGAGLCDGLLVSRRYTERERLGWTAEEENLKNSGERGNSIPEKKEKPEYFCTSYTARCLMTLCSQDYCILVE